VTPPIHVAVGQEVPTRLLPAIRYTLAEIGARAGARMILTDGPADIGLAMPGRISLPFDRRAWDGSGEAFLPTRQGLWASAERADDPDLLGGVFRLLTLADETGVTARDDKGVFFCASLPPSRQAVLDVPLVELHVAEIVRRLAAAGLNVPRIPAWPRPLALAITHDTDAVDFSAPSEILFNAGKAILRRNPDDRALVWEGLTGRRRPNPFFGFDHWADSERRRNCRSAFYLFHRMTVRRHLNDVRSSVFNRDVPWDRLRALADEGFEFGVHAAINAKNSLDEFIAVKAAVEDRIGHPVFGLRHHYFSIDWREPFRTWRKHVNAGFRYDTSIAWRDATGFRAGTCLPYRPWDPERQRALDLYVLPTSIMDAHILGAGTRAGLDGPVAAACALAQRIAGQNGLLVLDWHTETGCDAYKYKGYRTAAERILDTVLSKAWCATPWEITERWHARYSGSEPLRAVA
jgi:hypothetical protein